MMTVTTIIPKKRNNGKLVARREIVAILTSLTAQFGGHTVEGETQGEWRDPDTGEVYSDAGLKVTFGCDRSRLTEAEEAVIRIGRQLGQKAMWCEVRYSDGVRILNVD